MNFRRNPAGTLFFGVWKDNLVGRLQGVYTPPLFSHAPLPPPEGAVRVEGSNITKNIGLKWTRLKWPTPPPPFSDEGGKQRHRKKWAKWLEKGLAYITNQEPDPQWNSNPAPQGGEGYRTLIRGKEGGKEPFLINTNESIRAILAPNTGKQPPPDIQKSDYYSSWAQTTRGSGASVGTSRSRLETAEIEGTEYSLSKDVHTRFCQVNRWLELFNNKW